MQRFCRHSSFKNASIFYRTLTKTASVDNNNVIKMPLINFDNQTTKRLPADPNTGNSTRQVRAACFSRVEPTPVENPRLVAYSSSVLELLDLDEAVTKDTHFVEAVAGNELFEGSDPIALCYAGHQFGSFAGQLGDGRAISLGEMVNSRGERWELQLKGAGMTPYSRHADGRAVLRSSIREFLCSELMHGLGIATTRAATLIVSDSKVVRDPMYSGKPIFEKCAIVMRVAPSFFRFGSWEIFKPGDSMNPNGPSVGIEGLGQEMLNVTIDLHFPEIANDKSFTTPEAKYAEFFKQVVQRSARLVADWQLVGFTHGVLNTDNMSILGLTIDYGPFGFLDWYNPRFIPNTTDEGGRYRYEAQPGVFAWNLSKFAEALAFAKILPIDTTMTLIEENFNKSYEEHYLKKLRQKVGLEYLTESTDEALFVDLFNSMELTGADFTNTFRGLSKLSVEDESSTQTLLDFLIEQGCSVSDLARMSRPQLSKKQLAILQQFKEQDSAAYSAYTEGREDLIEVETKKWEEYEKLAQMTGEEKQNKDREIWTKWIASYKARLQRELAASQLQASTFDERRHVLMNKTNPKFILRNYLAQEAIDLAEQDDFSGVNRLLRVLLSPFEEHDDLASFAYHSKRPPKYCDFLLSCSS